jgi:hypothetical protein
LLAATFTTHSIPQILSQEHYHRVTLSLPLKVATIVFFLKKRITFLGNFVVFKKKKRITLLGNFVEHYHHVSLI